MSEHRSKYQITIIVSDPDSDIESDVVIDWDEFIDDPDILSDTLETLASDVDILVETFNKEELEG